MTGLLGAVMRAAKKKKAKKTQAKKAPKAVLFEIDGEHVSPQTVDSLVLLNLAEAFFRLVVRVAEADNLGLTFQGLSVVDKCAAIAAIPSDSNSARVSVARAKRIVSGGEAAPSGANDLVDRIRSGLRALDHNMKAGFRYGKVINLLRAPAIQSAEIPWEILELRAVPIRVGGKDPTVELASESELGSFIVKTGVDAKTSIDNARALGASLHKEVDVVIEASRNVDGRITNGHVLEVSVLQDGDPVAIWRTWFAEECPEWKDAEDTGHALGRYN